MRPGRQYRLLRAAPLLLLVLAGAAAGAGATSAEATRDIATGAEISDDKRVQAVVAQVDAGDFAGAEAAIAAALPDASTRDARVLQFQRERMRRIRLEFDQD